MWEPLRLTTLWASTSCYTDSFTFFILPRNKINRHRNLCQNYQMYVTFDYKRRTLYGNSSCRVCCRKLECCLLVCITPLLDTQIYVCLKSNRSFQINQCRHFNQSKRYGLCPLVSSFYCSSVSEDTYGTELEELN
jgi:hypothetical protein